MSETLLQTKLFKPALRSALVPRERLIEKLNKGLVGKVTIISAPAGFGKTTVVVDWLAQLQRPFGWLSLDEDDNDPHRFFTYVAAALATVKGETETVRPAPTLSPKAIATLLLNDLMQMAASGVLVLDDYHLIDVELIHETLTFFLDHLPPTLHLVLISRSDPPLPLARMRVRGELNELRERDLRFTIEETTIFLNQIMGLNLPEKDIVALGARAEGWIASLQLAALSLQDTHDTSQLIDDFRGTHRYVVDYLVEEVLAQRPAGTREFLLKTSILHRLSASLCNDLLSSDQSQKILEQLEVANFFLIPLDNERRWYRYHHLFADVLRQQAADAYPEQLPVLQQQAARWFEAHDLLYEAIEMALAGIDLDYAAQLILQAAVTEIWSYGEWLLLDRWLAALPESIIKTRPRLCLYQAWGSFIRGDLATCNARMTDADNAILEFPGSHKLAQGELAAIRASIARFQGNQAQVIAQADITLANLPEADNPWRVMTLLNLGAAHFLGDDQQAATEALTAVWQLAEAKKQAMWGAVSASFLAQLHVRNGRFHEAAQLYQQAQTIALSRQESTSINIGMTHVGLGELWLAWNNLDKAEEFLQQGLELGVTVQNILLILSGSLAFARLRQIQGDLDSAQSLIVRAQEIAQNPATAWSWLQVPTAAFLARAWIKQGVLPTAKRLLAAAVAEASGQSAYWVESLRIAQARLLLAEEKWNEAESLLVNLWRAAVSQARIRSQIEILVLQAVTQQKKQQPEQARTHLQDALTLALPSGELRLFLDEGLPIQEVIVSLSLSDLTLRTYAQKISEAFPDQQQDQAKMANQKLIEPLTARELELLALVATGISNREIAEQLVISYGTVRRHLNNIYGKLGVNGRAQAILKAQEQNLV